jgi:hydroxymethylbilane synthase
MRPTIRIGTRGSALALNQTGRVEAALRELAPNAPIVIETIASDGDRQADAPLETLGIGVFTKTLEAALLEGRIDLAVHSLKDLPTDTTPGLTVVPVLEREDPRDVLVDKWGLSLLELPEGARIGTSSPRRTAQLRHGRKDIEFPPMRGNVETRLRKVGSADYDGAVLAAAGIRRLGLEAQITEYLSPHVCTPAPGQAALAAEVRSGDEEMLEAVRRLMHAPTVAAVEAERAILSAAGGGCQLPIGALGEVDGDILRLFATVTPRDGSFSFRVEVAGSVDEPLITGIAAYQALFEQGAGAWMTGEAQ